MLPLKFALRFIFARKSHTAVNVISAVAVAGVAVATMAIVCVLSVFNGFSDLALSRLSVFDPELKITAADGRAIAGADSLAAAIAARCPGVASAVPVVTSEALAVAGDRQLTVVIKGVGENYAEADTALQSVVIDGVFDPSAPENDRFAAATVGVGCALRLDVRPSFGRMMRIFVPRRVGRINPANPMAAFRADTVVVSGVFQLDQPEYDNSAVLIPISTARALLDYSDEATAIETSIRPGSDPEAVRSEIRALLGDSFRIADRLEQQTASYRMISVEKWISLLLLVFILVIASFNVLSSVSMLVLEKRDDVATLRALGASPGFAGRIFMDQGTLITLVGAAAGIVLGVALCLAQEWGGFIRLAGDPSQLSVLVYPVRLQLTDLLVVAAVVLVVAAAVGALARLIADSLTSVRRVAVD